MDVPVVKSLAEDTPSENTANDKNVGLFYVFHSQATSHMDGSLDNVMAWLTTMRKSEGYRAAKTHVTRLQALQVRCSPITKGLFKVAERYDRAEHECPWFINFT